MRDVFLKSHGLCNRNLIAANVNRREQSTNLPFIFVWGVEFYKRNDKLATARALEHVFLHTFFYSRFFLPFSTMTMDRDPLSSWTINTVTDASSCHVPKLCLLLFETSYEPISNIRTKRERESRTSEALKYSVIPPKAVQSSVQPWFLPPWGKSEAIKWTYVSILFYRLPKKQFLGKTTKISIFSL